MDQVTEILILSANPKNTNRLRLDEEVREIEEGLQRSRNREQFKIRSKLAVRLRDLRRALLDYEPQIVHFSGHGEVNGLAVEDEVGNAVLLNPDALEGLFELFTDKVECVLLNACYSELQVQGISKHIQYVIGIRQGISDKAALEFSVGFYDAVGAGKSIEEAFRFGRNAIQIYNIPEHLNPILSKSVNIHSNSFLGGILDSKEYVFKFRAECDHDVNELDKLIGKHVKKIIKVRESLLPDVEVEIYVNLSLNELRNAMRKIEDGHVMVQTVAPKDKYTGERNYSL
ncbi:CHAT domain-containing protein [Dendronalium sp. ChiSLP03b]|uniref:CHAT domain-containing protein n=1 Tax=Dendronalium sp. ChiSLP03b TaxID=3075381 RepID=UPI002AD5B453|nr:CHAT domain-containing protein [Dendronalium sp. ChiSLP03b]MDZ8203646.1 CHAT domain-containing protein [Dendronalium sp. ChiSLP03b]